MNMTTDEMDRRAQKILNDAWNMMRQASMQEETENAKRDPVAHKKSKVFDDLRYRYYKAEDGKGREVRFCYSTTRNVAGYFLAWREVINKKGTTLKRDGYIANKVKRKLIERQRKQWAKLND